MSEATTAAPAASPAPDATTTAAPAPAAAAPAAAAPAPSAAPAPTAAPAAAPAPTPAPTAAPAAAPKADDKPAGAPEAYADFELPEGVQPDPKALDGFKAVAKELGLSQENAQKLVSFNTEAQIASVKQTIQGWQEAARGDKEIGGEKFDENMAVARSALDKFATPEFRTWLDKTGMGFHPELLRTFYRAGKAISEDGFVPGRNGAGANGSIAQRMYPNMNP